ncbi:hypothetical protein PI87_20720 [Ralstonia sp. A12]|nr:hypothetical protein PI87_20720 [Ralstonia sp. A12]
MLDDIIQRNQIESLLVFKRLNTSNMNTLDPNIIGKFRGIRIHIHPTDICPNSFHLKQEVPLPTPYIQHSRTINLKQR